MQTNIQAKATLVSQRDAKQSELDLLDILISICDGSIAADQATIDAAIAENGKKLTKLEGVNGLLVDRIKTLDPSFDYNVDMNEEAIQP